MRRSLLLLAGCCLAACGPVTTPPGDSDTTTLRLEANANGDLEHCDPDGTCHDFPNPDECAVFIITIDTLTGQTCERCENAAGQAIFERCDETRVVCGVFTAPEPDCVVCAIDGGPVVYSTCLPEDRPRECRWDSDCPSGFVCEGSSVCPPDVVCVWEGEPGVCVPEHSDACSDEECGPAPLCPAVQCEDGSYGGCGPCERDPQSGVCGWTWRECPAPGECRWDSDCPEGFLCEGSSVCPPDVECVWEGEPGICVPAQGCENDPAGCPNECSFDDCGPPPPCAALLCEDGTVVGCFCGYDETTGACGWQHATCPEPPLPECRWDSDCPEGSHCEGSSVCPPDVVCVWEGEPGVCVPDAHCLSDAGCPDGFYCNFDLDHDGYEDVRTGVCEPRPAECTPDECGPAPGAPNYLCEDGFSVGGPGPCERDPATGLCGWTWLTCPEKCGELYCAQGQICCNALQSLCVPENSDIACID